MSSVEELKSIGQPLCDNLVNETNSFETKVNDLSSDIDNFMSKNENLNNMVKNIVSDYNFIHNGLDFHKLLGIDRFITRNNNDENSVRDGSNDNVKENMDYNNTSLTGHSRVKSSEIESFFDERAFCSESSDKIIRVLKRARGEIDSDNDDDSDNESDNLILIIEIER